MRPIVGVLSAGKARSVPRAPLLPRKSVQLRTEWLSGGFQGAQTTCKKSSWMHFTVILGIRANVLPGRELIFAILDLNNI